MSRWSLPALDLGERIVYFEFGTAGELYIFTLTHVFCFESLEHLLLWDRLRALGWL